MISRTNIINDIFEIYNFNSYLEIGTRVPADNFDCINSKLKHSVDPNTDGRYYYTYNTTSDDFFQNYISQKYDVIFIDGMHTEEQVYKDVKNSIKNLNNNGFIVIHDCNPANKWLTRTYEEYLSDPGGWNGTVYRAYIRLKYELKKDNWCCFVVDENYGCGIITKNNILPNNLIEFNIDNFSWEDFEKNRNDILQLISYDEYKKIINK
jgi:hypothetical protein